MIQARLLPPDRCLSNTGSYCLNRWEYTPGKFRQFYTIRLKLNIFPGYHWPLLSMSTEIILIKCFLKGTLPPKKTLFFLFHNPLWKYIINHYQSLQNFFCINLQFKVRDCMRKELFGVGVALTLGGFSKLYNYFSNQSTFHAKAPTWPPWSVLSCK